MTSRRAIGLLCGVLIFGACAAAEPSPLPEQRLGTDDFPRPGGCADVILYATTDDDRIAVRVDWPGAAAAAQAEGQFSETVQLPLAEVTVRLQMGRFLSYGFCTDVIVEGRPAIVAETEAFEGQAQLTVVSENGDPTFPIGRATLVLTDVIFEVDTVEGVEQWRIERLELHDIEVGWLPG